ncbi:hypothetical protein HAX54_016713, partial [Datura stramonium]|nr:hypothetical protein [Datura stramonium]
MLLGAALKVSHLSFFFSIAIRQGLLLCNIPCRCFDDVVRCLLKVKMLNIWLIVGQTKEPRSMNSNANQRVSPRENWGTTTTLAYGGTKTRPFWCHDPKSGHDGTYYNP